MTRAAWATYRVQLHAGFGFAAAASLVPYLRRLGFTHLYCSPILQATPGSLHGYDVVDHSRISEDLGGEEGLAHLHRTLTGAGLGLVVDIVPNHMAAVGPANQWWWDVLENGPASMHAGAFDINWDPPEAKLRQRVLVPVLADHYGRVLEAGELKLARRRGAFTVSYHDHVLPVSPRTLDEVLAAAAAQPAAGNASGELMELARAFGALPHATATDPASVVRRHHDKEVLRSRLAALCADHSAAAAVDAAVALFNVDPDRLDTLLQRQNYRLARWKVAGHELDYRRFFDVSELVAIRVEDPAVFEESHARIIQLAKDGMVAGLRVDHPDGLRDPAGYLRRLRDAVGPLWIVVEKILAGGEELPPSWETDGTTGYDFLNLVSGLFIDPAGEASLTGLWSEVADQSDRGEAAAVTARLDVMATSLAADIERLTELLVGVCEARRRFRDFSRVELRHALRTALAVFPVYRTYVRPDGSRRAQDEVVVRRALDQARRLRPDLDPELFDLLEQVLLATRKAPIEVDLAMRFQQTSAAVMAKGVEDTAFYRDARLLVVNEVGGELDRFGVTPEELHAHNARMARDWPATMVCTSTHDTKRSEDTRARLALLSEIPSAWREAVARWSDRAAAYRVGAWPDRQAEYVLFQTLVAAHPLDADRACRFMEKAVREAKRHTSWTSPDQAYETAVTGLVRGLLSDREFRRDLDDFVRPLVGPGRVSALAQTLLRLTSPGVPDTYQGTEVWDHSLVDPDNRRLVDHARLAGLLDDCDRLDPATAAADVLARADEGMPKLFLLRRALAVRAEWPAAFDPGGSYEPVWATGPAAAHLVAYVRGGVVLTAVPRLVLGLERRGGWRGTSLTLPPGTWVDRLSGRTWSGRVPLAELLGAFPVGLLVVEDGNR